MKVTGERLLQVGIWVAGVGPALGIGWGIWAAQSATAHLWEWPMLVAICIGVVGVAVIVASFFVGGGSPGDGGIKQKQSGGKGSVNIQAGRDITYHNKKDDRP